MSHPLGSIHTGPQATVAAVRKVVKQRARERSGRCKKSKMSRYALKLEHHHANIDAHELLTGFDCLLQERINLCHRFFGFRVKLLHLHTEFIRLAVDHLEFLFSVALRRFGRRCLGIGCLRTVRVLVLVGFRISGNTCHT